MTLRLQFPFLPCAPPSNLTFIELPSTYAHPHRTGLNCLISRPTGNTMPPIQVFSNSPINAAKPSGTTPKTAQDGHQEKNDTPPVTTTASNTQAYAPQQDAYPKAQPGAVPSLPAPTGIASLQPTPTQSLRDTGPPAPQPGAVPVPSGTSSHLPPPPRVGEKLQQQQQQQTTLPPQMSYSLAGTHAPPHYGSSTTTAPDPTGYPGPKPTSLMEGGAGASQSSFDQPLGYQPPGARQQSSGYGPGPRYDGQQRSHQDDDDYDGQDDSVWGTAKKWAQAAGDSLAAAESEVWKRINKDP
jgi:hypothetical protein